MSVPRTAHAIKVPMIRTEETIKKLKDYVDVYLVDLKYMNNELSARYSSANDYVEKATGSILQMKQNQPTDIIEILFFRNFISETLASIIFLT